MKKKKNVRFSGKLGLFFLIIWVLVLAGATVVSLMRERDSLPEVVVGKPGRDTLTYSCSLTAQTVSETEAELEIPYDRYLLPPMFAEGTELEIGTVRAVEQEESGYMVRIALSGSGEEGEELPVTLSYTGEFAQVVNRNCIGNEIGMPCLYEVTEQKGAWGREYVLRAVNAACFPMDLSLEREAVLTELENPVVLESSGELCAGMKVRVKEG